MAISRWVAEAWTHGGDHWVLTGWHHEEKRPCNGNNEQPFAHYTTIMGRNSAWWLENIRYSFSLVLSRMDFAEIKQPFLAPLFRWYAPSAHQPVSQKISIDPFTDYRTSCWSVISSEELQATANSIIDKRIEQAKYAAVTGHNVGWICNVNPKHIIHLGMVGKSSQRRKQYHSSPGQANL